MATRKEFTGIRNLDLSRWIRTNLPDSSTGYMVTDVDFFLFNYKTKKMMVLEVKTRKTGLRKWQSIFYNNLEKWLTKGMKDDGWTFLGCHVLIFENTFFDDGLAYFDGKEVITEEDLIKRLSF